MKERWKLIVVVGDIKIMFPKILIPKPVVKIIQLDRQTAGKKHYWCWAIVNGLDFKVRKPISAIKKLLKVKN